MSINLTVKSGTTRTYPQKGDDDLHGEATAWAQDMTTGINNAPTYSEIIQFDAVVGTAANVTAGIATHSDLSTAITAISAGDTIFVLDCDLEPAAQVDISKACWIVGQGESSVIEGDNIAAGAVVKISAVGVTLQNIKIIQGSGTPDYALEIAAAMQRINLDIKADGTFAVGLYLNGSDVGGITGFISYDTSSVFFGGESQMVEQIKIQDQTTPAYNLNIQSDSDGSVLTADRIFTIDCNDGARSLDLSENLTVGDGYNVTLTAEDAASSIVLDEQSFEVEGEGTASQLFKLVNAENAARTVTFNEDLTIGDGADITITAEDNNAAIVYDNVNLEVENTDGTQRDWKFTSAKAGNTTVTLEENLSLGDGYDLTMTCQDAATAVVYDNVNLEVENTDGTQRDWKFTSAKAGNTTVTLEENLTIGDGYDVTITAEDAASSITLDEQSFEVEGEGTASQLFKLVNAENAARTLTFNEDLTIGDGAAVTIVAEDTATTITMDEQNFEVEGEGTAAQLTKIVNANNEAATLTLEGTAGVVNQDLSSDNAPTFTGITNDSADITISTTTSGDVNLNSVDEMVVVSSGSDTSATTNTVKFGDDTGGITGIRNLNGAMGFQDSGGGWTGFASAAGANAGLSNLAGVAINDSLISDTDSTDNLGSTAIAWNNVYADNYHVENGVEIIESYHENAAGDFPDGADLYAWNHNAVGAWADEDWDGATALTEVGAISTATTHLGLANAYIDFDGTNDEVYAGVATFDSADESFTTGGWFYFDRTGTDEYLISKDEADNADKSFIVHHDNTGANLTFVVYYDNGGNTVTITMDDSIVTDSAWHHIVAVYDQANTVIYLYIDGIQIGYCFDANLATRNNGTTSELTFGGRYDTATATVEIPFDGKITDMFYKIDVLTAAEVKNLYAGGCGQVVSEDASTGALNILRDDHTHTQSCFLAEVQAAGTNGGTFTQDTWQVRTLNVLNEDASVTNKGSSFCTLDTNAFTLGPGKYYIAGRAPAEKVNSTTCRLYNVTATAAAIVGCCSQVAAADGNITHDSKFWGIVTITVPTQFRLEHRCQTTNNTYGLGTGHNDQECIYSQVRIDKILN